MAETLAMLTSAPDSTPAERRLRREWDLLNDLVRLNPSRLSSPRAVDTTFFVTLRQTPAITIDRREEEIVQRHTLRLEYPRFFPALPLELYLERPMRHPNIHPITGFVCLWQSHRIEHSVEHALHRTVAILGWQLMNLDSRHVMQPESLTEAHHDLASRLHTQSLAGLDHSAQALHPAPQNRRRRLS